MKTSRPPFFAEVIEGSLTHLQALCWQWNQTEPFGSLIATQTDDITIFAVTSSIQEGSADPTRTPHAYKKTETELRRDHPHIFEFLQTRISGKIIGFCAAQKFISNLPPKPPSLHAFVRPATKDERYQILQAPHFLHLLCSDISPASADELILGFIYQETKQQSYSTKDLDLYALACAHVLQNDYTRLRLLFQRMESFVTL